MADVAQEIKETVAEKEISETEDTKTEEVEESPAESSEKKDETPAAEENADENGVERKCELRNGCAKQNGVAEKDAESKETEESNEVCGIKRKSVGSEATEAEVESSEKKQKLEDSAEPEAANGHIDAKA